MPHTTGEASSMPQFRGARVTTRSMAGDAAELVLAGEFDLDNASALEAALCAPLERGCRSLTLDAQDVTFLDSTILAVLLHAHRRCCELGGAFVLTGVQGNVARLMETTGLDQVMRSRSSS